MTKIKTTPIDKAVLKSFRRETDPQPKTKIPMNVQCTCQCCIDVIIFRILSRVGVNAPLCPPTLNASRYMHVIMCMHELDSEMQTNMHKLARTFSLLCEGIQWINHLQWKTAVRYYTYMLLNLMCSSKTHMGEYERSH